MYRLFLMALITATVLLACSKQTVREPVGPPIATKDEVMASVGKETLRAVSKAKTCKKNFASDASALENCRKKYEDVYVAGKFMTDNAADMIVNRRWDEERIGQEKAALDAAMAQLVEAADGTAVGGSVAVIAGPIIDLLFKVYDLWIKRDADARTTLANSIKAHTWTQWEDIKAAG